MKEKKEYQDLLMKMLCPLKKSYTEGKAGLKAGATGACYPEKTIRMEGFSRILWGLVPFWAGGGVDEEFADIYREGFRNGTNPEHVEYWGTVHDCDQKFVEMAAIAYGMIAAPETVWCGLDPDTRYHMEAWLGSINQKNVADNNWQFFRILTNVALKKNGMEYSNQALEASLQRVEDFYLGDGWYQDGLTAQKDYYISFAIHFYSLLYVIAMEKEDPVRCQSYRERAGLFAGQFIYWFAENGEALPYGRSLTYRFAQVAFWSMAVVAGLDTVSLPVMKGIITRHLQYWIKQPIFDHSGKLTIGYAYPNLHMAESYNAPGSPYWALKAFAFLMLPDSHEFWSVEADPLPPLEKLKVLKQGEMIVQRRPGEVVGYVPGVHYPNKQVFVPEKYSKFAYSTYFGFSVPRSSRGVSEAVPDSMLAFEIGGHIFVKQMIEDFSIENNMVQMSWSPFDGIHVETRIIPTEGGHIREHVIDSDISCTAYDCGFAVSSKGSNFYKNSKKNLACAGNDEAVCQVRSKVCDGEGVVIWGEPNTNLLTQNTEIPAIKFTIPAGKSKIGTEILTEVIQKE